MAKPTQIIVEAVGRAAGNRDSQTRAALAAIDGLTLDDCLQFFDQRDERTKRIVEMAEEDDTFEADAHNVVTDSELNGAYVLGWRWVDFEGTDLDENNEGRAVE